MLHLQYACEKNHITRWHCLQTQIVYHNLLIMQQNYSYSIYSMEKGEINHMKEMC